MPSTNQTLAGLFQEMADVMQILGVDVFKVRAFEKVARVLEQHPEDITNIGPDEKRLQEIAGIGKGSAARIAEYLNTGHIKDHEELIAQFPPTLRELMRIPGLGFKTIAMLWKECGIKSLAELQQKLDSSPDEICGLKGMGQKKVDALKKNIAYIQTAAQRVRIGAARPLAQWFIDRLRQLPEVKEITCTGSLRRGKETIGDIDLLVAARAEDAGKISDAFVKLGPVAEVIARGETKTSIRTHRDGHDGLQVDLRIVPRETYGASLMYFTGSKEHNVRLRERAIKRKLKLSEYGLFDAAEKVVAGRTEEEVYKALGLAWIPPELREDLGEIALAEKNKLPKLIELSDIRCELHAHTIASDGKWTIQELAEAAAERGFHTIAVTDHSKSQVQANGLTAARLERHIEDVRAVAAKLKGKITVLAGTEVDILADGTLDYPNSLLKELDVVVASPHAALSQEGDKATPRLLKAIENPYVTIMGHATGRIILRREGMKPDIHTLVKAAAERGVVMEINANHYRLDLRDSHARAALEAGCRLAINTDAHGMADLNELIYGVLTARRAGATREQVINCMERDELASWLKARRQH